MTGYGYEGYGDSNWPVSPSQGSEEDEDDYDNRRQEWMDARKIIHPQPGQFKPPGQRFYEEHKDVMYEDLPTVDLGKTLGDCRSSLNSLLSIFPRKSQLMMGDLGMLKVN